MFGESWLNNAIITGRTSNPTYVPNSQGFQFYDTWTKTILSNIKFRNYHKDPTASNPQEDNMCLISMTHSDQFKPQGNQIISSFIKVL